MTKFLTSILLCLASALTTSGADVPTVKMEACRMPDLNIPRAGHALMQIDGELTVIGGHTTGFIPTATAEYLKGGKWNTVPSLYTHDNGFCLQLKDGTVMLGGGLPEDFGVGQSFSAERYLPETHSFEPLPILDRKRALSNAVEMEDGSILVSGNWYADDALEKYSAREGFVNVKGMAENRSNPWILPTAKDNAIIFSATDSWGKPGQGWVDRLNGEAFHLPLLLQMPPARLDDMCQSPCKIGDYDYLMLANNDSLETNGILRIHGEEFSLLALEADIPVKGIGGPISYFHKLLKYGDYAWALGTDPEHRAYLLQIGYLSALQGGKATLKLHYTDPLEDLPKYGSCVMLPDGRIALAGGLDCSNYTPYASVYIFDPGTTEVAAAGGISARTAGMLVGILAALSLVALGWWIVHRRKKPEQESPAPEQADLKSRRDRDIFDKVSALMEEGLYTKKGLSIADLATTLGTNTKYISSCINAGAGCSYLDYINGYRVRFAQKKMREEPQMRLSEIADAAGFASESAFDRNFKAITGQTPAEWLNKQ